MATINCSIPFVVWRNRSSLLRSSNISVATLATLVATLVAASMAFLVATELVTTYILKAVKNRTLESES